MRLPPLNALRAFEAAARHGGYIPAAEELCVTRGAISRHVKLLEEHLGCTLFHRGTAGVELTEAGTRLLPVLTDAFRRIADQAREIADTGPGLSILCPPASSIRWLMPRISRFRAAHPDIPLRVTSDFFGPRPFELSSYDIGFSVEKKEGRSRDLQVQPFMPCLLTPATAPDIAQSLRSPGDLADLPLLREAPFGKDWETWLGHFGIPGIDASNAQVFANLDIAVQAAALGEGVVMADPILCRPEIEAGTLVLPFPRMICPAASGEFALIGRAQRWNDRDVTAFRNWVAEEGQEERARLGILPGASSAS